MRDGRDRPPSYLSAASLARELDVSETTILELVRKGILPRGIKLGGSVRYSWTEVQAALSSLKGAAADASGGDPFLAGVMNATAPAARRN